MKQVFFFHGGDSFSSYEVYIENLKAKVIDYERLKPSPRWREWVARNLTDTDVLLPTMPNGYNAVFDEWKIYFEKLIPFFGDDVTLVGHSLGGMFLAKYLQTHHLPHKVRRVVLIAAVYGHHADSDNGSFEVESATNLSKNTEEVHLFHSKDDPHVPYEDVTKYKHDMPEATAHSFESRGHFIDATFPEILELLQQK